MTIKIDFIFCNRKGKNKTKKQAKIFYNRNEKVVENSGIFAIACINSSWPIPPECCKSISLSNCINIKYYFNQKQAD